MMAASETECVDSLRKHLIESCRRELSKAFSAWVLGKPQEGLDLVLIADQAANSERADLDFQIVAILGFAAAAGILSDGQRQKLRMGLSRLAGRNPVINGARVAFTCDAVGLLGVALGTKAISDAELTARMAAWATKFLTDSYHMDHVEDWQRCLLAVVDRELKISLNLPMPRSAAAASARMAMAARGLIDDAESPEVKQNKDRQAALVFQEAENDLDCEPTALRLTAAEYLLRTDDIAGKQNKPAFEQVCAEPLGRASESSRVTRKSTKPQRRNPGSESIDRALKAIAASQPRSQKEVFRALQDRRVILPRAEPFASANSWVKGFHHNAPAARTWLSKRWAELGLPSLVRPRKPQSGTS